MKRRLALVSAVASLALVTAACGGGEEEATTAGAEETTSSSEETTTPSEDATTESSDDSMEMASGPVGPGCEDYAAAVPEGEGSVEGMTDDPVAVAASNNPLLTQLTAAVSGQLNPDVNLVDTLNGDEFTVFAPVDDAFAALPPETVTTLQQDADLLTSILTYHVVPGQISPEEIAGTTQTTVQGGTVEVTGEPDMLMVNDANVICGGVMTANATVYLIDSVLQPTS